MCKLGRISNRDEQGEGDSTAHVEVNNPASDNQHIDDITTLPWKGFIWALHSGW